MRQKSAYYRLSKWDDISDKGQDRDKIIFRWATGNFSSVGYLESSKTTKRNFQLMSNQMTRVKAKTTGQKNGIKNAQICIIPNNCKGVFRKSCRTGRCPNDAFGGQGLGEGPETERGQERLGGRP